MRIGPCSMVLNQTVAPAGTSMSSRPFPIVTEPPCSSSDFQPSESMKKSSVYKGGPTLKRESLTLAVGGAVELHAVETTASSEATIKRYRIRCRSKIKVVDVVLGEREGNAQQDVVAADFHVAQVSCFE